MTILIKATALFMEEKNLTCSDALRKRSSELCKRRNITTNHLADMAGLRQSTVDAVVRGVTKNPGLKSIYQIATGFGMTLSEFLDFPEMNEVEFDDFN